MKNICIKRVILEGIHKRYDLDISFNDSLNVLHGQNGTGKSTLLHVIANILNCDYIRFAYLEFSKIEIFFSNEMHLRISPHDYSDRSVIKVETQSGNSLEFSKSDAQEASMRLEDDRYQGEIIPDLIRRLRVFTESNNLKIIETSYFPAFRTMLEAWSSQKENSDRPRHVGLHRAHMVSRSTSFSRNLFGQFLPTINFPSPIDIEENLRGEIRDAQIKIARYESSIFSNSFVKVFSALLEGSGPNLDAKTLLNEISELTESRTNNKLGDLEENSLTYSELQRLVEGSARSTELATSAIGALAVYRDALKERQEYQKNSFKEIDKYFEIVNSFLDKKELSYNIDKMRRIPKVGLKFPDETWSSIRVMSSGERQLLTMLYAVNKMSGNTAVLIDEPELSLHIDWQEDLLGKMMEQLGDRQIIVCTHSPSIAAEFHEYMKEIVPDFKDSSSLDHDGIDDEEFI